MAKTSGLRNKTIIVGCGRFGSSVANTFSREGKNIIVIDQNPANFEALDDRFSGYTFVGDATDLSILESANIASAYEIVITTGNDNINLFLAHVARKVYDIPQIYVRLDDPEMEVMLTGINVQAIFPFDLSLKKFNLMRGDK